MCGYNENDWNELAKMSEVLLQFKVFVLKWCHCFIKWLKSECFELGHTHSRN